MELKPETINELEKYAQVEKAICFSNRLIFCASGHEGLRSYFLKPDDSVKYLSSNDQGDYYESICSFKNFIICACRTGGARCYIYDNDGYLTFMDSDDQGDNYHDVCTDGNFLYFACGTGGLRSYYVDLSGMFIYLDCDDRGGEYKKVWIENDIIHCDRELKSRLTIMPENKSQCTILKYKSDKVGNLKLIIE